MNCDKNGERYLNKLKYVVWNYDMGTIGKPINLHRDPN